VHAAAEYGCSHGQQAEADLCKFDPGCACAAPDFLGRGCRNPAHVREDYICRVAATTWMVVGEPECWLTGDLSAGSGAANSVLLPGASCWLGSICAASNFSREKSVVLAATLAVLPKPSIFDLGLCPDDRAIWKQLDLDPVAYFRRAG